MKNKTHIVTAFAIGVVSGLLGCVRRRTRTGLGAITARS